MNLHKSILYFITFIIIYFPITTPLRNKDLIVNKTGIEEISPCSVGIQFFQVLNNTSDEDFYVELLSNECCINSDEILDCDSLEIIGECSDVIRKGKVKTFTLVAPVLDPFERKGYCVIHVDSRPVDKHNNIMRDTIQIDFDTGIDNYKEINESDTVETIKKCKNRDEDPLNDCKPVNCDTHYNGQKPVYDRNTKRCIEVPKCKNKDTSTRVYDPIMNRCVDSEPISIKDIDFVKSLNRDRHPKDVIIVEAHANHPEPYNATLYDNSSKTNNVSFASKNNYAQMFVKNKPYCGSIIKYLTANKYTLLVLGMVIFVQCCLIFTMIYCLTKRSISCDKKVERKYFNYKQDVSVTTPLIATSNMDTETTGIEYISESSHDNINKKIKCYKACQKERKNDTKISMSDDILAKCLNRRDWNTKPKSYTNNYDDNKFYDDNIISHVEWSSKKSDMNEITREKHAREKSEDKQEKLSSEEKHSISAKNHEDHSKRKDDYTESDSSEKLLQCHNYNFSESRRKTSDERYEPSKRGTKASMSTEKGAQACFSNDSIDDFLSERGITFLAGETLSKYSTNSTPTSSLELSGKTSKNNIVKNVLSYLSRKSKICTSSDPGVSKSKSKDLELIHMSRASVCSSASEFKNLKGVKLEKDSRSSF